MLYRNLMAMDVEECIRAYPVDGVVLLCGCDKTTPALAPRRWQWFPEGRCSAASGAAKTWAPARLTAVTGMSFAPAASARKLGVKSSRAFSRSPGHCNTTGTASTMTNLAEALGMTLPGCASIPAPDSRRLSTAEASGRRMVEMVKEDLRPSRILTPEAFPNAIIVDMAIGGSTNAIIHLVAIAGRLASTFHSPSLTKAHAAHLYWLT